MIPAGDHHSRTLLFRRISKRSSFPPSLPATRRGESEQEHDDQQRDDDARVQQPQSPAAFPLEDEGLDSTSRHDDGDSRHEQLRRPLLLDLLELEERSAHSGDNDQFTVLSAAVSTAVSRTLKRVGKNMKLSIVFLLLVAAGVSNAVLAKLQSLPMYNYPTFLTIYSNLMYIPIAFIYILPVSYFGWFHNSIRPSHWKMSKRPFVIMGALDAVSSGLQVLCSTYLPGTLIVLLPQAAIPFSMFFSRVLLKERFTVHQYVGAAIVLTAIVTVLYPVLLEEHAPLHSCQALESNNYCFLCERALTQHACLSLATHTEINPNTTAGADLFAADVVGDVIGDADLGRNFGQVCHWVSRSESIRQDDFLIFVWSLVLVASTIPMTLSSIYKQVAVSEDAQFDPMFVNGWVAVFQFLFSLPLCIPAAVASSPPVAPSSLPDNWWNGIQCLMHSENFVETGCHPDKCEGASVWVHLALLSSVATTIAVILMLKYGSASIMYLALTASVPLGHLVFELHSKSANPFYNLGGMILVVVGLLLYRFGHFKPEQHDELDSTQSRNRRSRWQSHGSGDDDSLGGYWEFLREPFLMVGDV